MNTVVMLALAAAAAYAFLGNDRLEQLVAAAHARLPAVELRHVIGAALLVLLAWTWSSSGSQSPTPAPEPGGPIVLRGRFSPTPTAAADAATLQALFDELAAEVEWDSMQPEPLIRTGVAFDDLRVRAFDLRLRGESIGERHPRVREAIKAYLDATAGTSGKPLTPAQRAAWIAAYREVARAAGEATR